MLGAAAAVLALRVVFAWDGLVQAAGSDGPSDPRIVPLVLLSLWTFEIAALPLETWLSRRWERVADRFALDLTGDGKALEAMHRRLALANLADLDPPPLAVRAPVHAPDPAGADRGRENARMSHSHAHTSARRPLAIALGLILGLMVGEVVFGVVAGSLALIADAGHMLTDAAALGLALVAATFAGRPAQGRWTFGFRRLEILAAQVNGITLPSSASVIVYVAIAPAARPARGARRDRARRRARRDRRQPRRGGLALAGASRHSLNVRGAFLHVATDLAAFVGHGGRGRDRARHRLEPRRPGCEPRGRGADLLVELPAPA